MNALAVVLQQPEALTLSRLELCAATDEDVVVDIEWSGISTGTERLLWTGRMPAFPGMGYPLVPGYESVGRVTQAGARSGAKLGDRVFVPGAKCFGDVRGWFGGAASRVVLPGARTVRLSERLGEQGVLLALAATAHHVAGGAADRQPDLIIGHGVLGRLIAAHKGSAPLRILDVAAGSGRYVLESVKRYQDTPMAVTLRDFAPHNLEAARVLAQQLGLAEGRVQIDYQLRDAFDSASYPAAEGRYDIVIVSGLYELFSDNASVAASLHAISGALSEGGHLVYTGQPWHPQLDMIAQTLDNHQGRPWVMRPRPQAELDALVRAAGLRKVSTQIGLEGIFNVSLAQKAAPPAAG